MKTMQTKPMIQRMPRPTKFRCPQPRQPRNLNRRQARRACLAMMIGGRS
jgi:hypothetical protein